MENTTSCLIQPVRDAGLILSALRKNSAEAADLGDQRK